MKRALILMLLLACSSASLAQLSGPLSGTLGPGVFHVVDTISVESTDTLRLMPGTTFTFDGPFPFRIYGTLLGEGTETDSIVFTTDTLANPDRWRGLRFLSGSDSSRLTYCLIEKGNANGDYPDNCGGGVYCDNSSPDFTNCIINGNSASNFGGGVYCYGSWALFTNCIFSGNLAAVWGGGVESYYSGATFINCIFSGNLTSGDGGGVNCSDDCVSIFTNCTFSGNRAHDGGGVYCFYFGSVSFTNCIFVDNVADSLGGGIYCTDDSSPIFTYCAVKRNVADGGGGIYCWFSSPTFTNCMVDSNAANNGGGAYCEAGSSPTFRNCIVNANSASVDGGGVYCLSSSPDFDNCTISRNSAAGSSDAEGGGVHLDQSSPIFTYCTISSNSANTAGGVLCDESSPIFTNCTMSGNIADFIGGIYCLASSPIFNSTILAFSVGSGVEFRESAGSTIRYCNISDNSGGDITFFNNDASQGPPSIGQLDTTNANGDSCDIYFNIFLNPMFVDTAAADFHLLTGSPCIDAGDPALPLDPDSTIADIGAFYFHQLAAEPIAVLLPKAYTLHPNWPNPFNSTTMIRYDVPQAGKVSLTIFNLLGQRVATVFYGRQLAGSYTIAWDAANLPSGVYLCRMDAAGFVQTRKLLLVK